MLAVLCGGQGRVSKDIFTLTERRQEAVTIFESAARLLGRDPRTIAQSSCSDALPNRFSQLLSITSSLALYACIRDLLPEQFLVAGYSVGEMAAWSIAGAWSTCSALEITNARAQIMDEVNSVRGQMGYIRGLKKEVLVELLEKNHCFISISNPGDLFIVSGKKEDLDSLYEVASATGASHYGPLSIYVPSHTFLLKEGIAPFYRMLSNFFICSLKPGRILLSGGNGSRIFNPEEALEDLSRQIATPLDWISTFEAIQELGVTRILDLGPGDALACMARNALPSARCYPTSGFHSIDGLRKWISDQAQ